MSGPSGNQLVLFSFVLENTGHLPFRKFRLENQKSRATPFRKLQKIWAVIWGDAIFVLFLVCFGKIFCSGPFYHLVKFYSFKFMHQISTQVRVCIMVSTSLFPSGPDTKCIILPNIIQGHYSWFHYLTDVVTRVLLDQLDCFVIDICFFHFTYVKDHTSICRAMTSWKTTSL